MTVVATAGHVDHGKSTLVKALTGTDPDRLKEEKARGLTIDLGFAQLVLPSGREMSFIDVPGHIRFLRNMLAGVGAVDACVFVVAATEGWKPQSEEHLRILDLLGVSHGVVALTMIDQVDEDLVELASLEVAEHVGGTFLEGADVVPVSAISGEGLDQVRAAIDSMLESVGQPVDQDRPRLWIDRSFSPAGAGTVVTGTLTGGALTVGDELLAIRSVDHKTGGLVGKIRGLQSHHQFSDTIPPGNRVAVNLTGISANELGRGDVLVRSGQWHYAKTVDAELSVLASLSHDVSRRGAYAAYIGSGEFPAKVRVLGPDMLTPGSEGAIRIYLPHAIPVLPGDRYILRERGRDETIGGGQLLDVDPQLPASKAKPDRSTGRLVTERKWLEAAELELLTGVAVEPNLGVWVIDPEVLVQLQNQARTKVAEAGPLGLDLASLSPQERAVIDTEEEFIVEQGRATLGQIVDPLADHRWVAELTASPFSPSGSDGVDKGELRELIRKGFVVEESGIYFSAEALARAGQLLANAFDRQPEGLTVAEIRDLFGTSRKYVLAILAHTDGSGMTRRREDLRIAGPRLPDPQG